VFTPFLEIPMVNPGFGGSGDPSAVNPNETENDRALIGEGIVIIVVIKTSAGIMVCITVKCYIIYTMNEAVFRSHRVTVPLVSSQ